MAKFEQRDNSGSIFKNEDRKTDKHPHGTGTAMIDGVEYWVSAWTKEGKKGKFQSLAFKRKEERTSSGIKRNAGIDDEDKIPF